MKKRPATPGRPGNDDAADADAFAREMADVVPLPRDPRGRIARRPLPPPRERVPAGRADAPHEADGSFAAPGIDRREIRKLTRGDYVAADRRDLHGMTATDACASVRAFVEASRQHGRRCICIVHGRGLHSEGQIAVLKARVRECLRAHAAVLAYADAPPSDGGGGAVYVLLRRQRRAD